MALRLLNSLQGLREDDSCFPTVIHHGLGEAFGSDFIERSIEHFETAISFVRGASASLQLKTEQAYIQLAQLFVLKNDEIKAIDLLKKGITLYEKYCQTLERVYSRQRSYCVT